MRNSLVPEICRWAAVTLAIALLATPAASAFQSTGKSKAVRAAGKGTASKSGLSEASTESQTCPYLTRSSVRKDGSGLNRHAAGSQVCFERQLMMCVSGRWQSRGPCDAYDKPRQAYDIEGSDPTSQSISPASADVERGGSTAVNGSGGAGSREYGSRRIGAPTLLGENPLQQTIEQTEAEIADTTREIEQRSGKRTSNSDQPTGHSGVGRTGSSTNAGVGSSSSYCGDAKASLAYADSAIAATEGNLRTFSATSNVSSPELTQLRTIREDLISKMTAAKCN